MNWRLFASIYTPFIYQYARKNGLQDADAVDLAQETMCSVVRTICDFEYDPKRGSFRGWLLTVVRNALRKRFRTLKHEPRGAGDTQVNALLQQNPDPNVVEDQWDRDYELWLFHKVAQLIRPEFQPKTWDAFWKTTVEGMEVSDVSARLSMSAGAVYIARSRVLARLRSEVSRLETWEP
jgi:RNA polymerase sigma factor (sigma-70 family)